ncbi:hypothetical protein [Patulibacter defluvii]|uniref:hypothetical protein n=1 Tax=Patulibacter defluvii TaxID=3095358 RepID=UPI002A74C1CD|nr:hypothetical protein [Patulibacter sp. DM4]
MTFAPARRTARLATVTAASAVVLLGPAAAAAPAAPFTTAVAEVCRYSFDQNWRDIDATIGGELVDGAGNPLGGSLAVGQPLRLRGGAITAALPQWVLPFAYDSGMVPLGDGSFPVEAWVALEATNTAEGITAPIHTTTTVRTHVVLDGNGQVDESRSSLTVDRAPLPEQTWTATGGEVVVRQAPGTKMAPIPVGRNGDLRVNGTAYIRAQVDSLTRLDLDCTPGRQDPPSPHPQAGLTHNDAVPPPLGGQTVAVAGFGGTVDATPLTDPVQADLLVSSMPARAAAGQSTTVGDARLRLRLTPAQRAAWLGGGTVRVSGSVVVHGARSSNGSQPVAIVATDVDGSGSGEIALPLAASTWTAAGGDGIDLRGDRTITLTASNGRVLQLQRIHAGDPYPFAYVLGPDPLQRIDNDDKPGGQTPPPIDGGGFAPPPKTAKATTVRIRSSALRRDRKGRVTVRLTNLAKKAATSGRVSVVTRSRYRVGGRKAKRIVTVAPATRFSLKKGKTASLRLKVGRDGAALLRTRRSLAVVIRVVPTRAATQKTVTRKATVRR